MYSFSVVICLYCIIRFIIYFHFLQKLMMQFDDRTNDCFSLMYFKVNTWNFTFSDPLYNSSWLHVYMWLKFVWASRWASIPPSMHGIKVILSVLICKTHVRLVCVYLFFMHLSLMSHLWAEMLFTTGTSRNLDVRLTQERRGMCFYELISDWTHMPTVTTGKQSWEHDKDQKMSSSVSVYAVLSTFFV